MRRSLVCLLGLAAAVVLHAPRGSAQEPPGRSNRASDRSTLSKLAVPAPHAKSIATALNLRYRDVPGITVSPDEQSGQLVVMAPEAAHPQIAADARSLIDNAVRPASATGTGPLRMRLAHITWREFEDNLHRVAGKELPVTTSRNGERASFQLTAAPLDGTTVEVDRRVNSVTVVAPGPKLPGWESLIEAIDRMPNRRSDVTELVRIQNAEPGPVQRAVRLLRQLEGDPQDQAAVVPAPGRMAFQNAVFQPQAAPGPQAPQNAPQNEDEPPADAAEGQQGEGVIGDVQIQFVPELGVIIVRGPRRDVERVRSVIEEIEVQAELTQPEVVVQRLEHTDANAVASLLQQLYEDVLSARQGEVSITSLDTPNALLLIGREEAINTVRDLITKIDQPIEDTDRLRVFRLQHASASDAEETIRNFFSEQPDEGDEPRPGIGIRVRIIADYRTNSLVVSASPRDMQEVTRLINKLDVQEISAQSEIKVFPLNNVRGEDLAETIQTAIDGEADEDEEGAAPSTTLTIETLNGPDSTKLDSGILTGVTVTADTTANKLVVRAPASSMPLISELIRQLDQAPEIESVVKVFTIQNGDATQLTTALQNLFGEQAATGGTQVGGGNLQALAGTTARKARWSRCGSRPTSAAIASLPAAHPPTSTSSRASCCGSTRRASPSGSPK